MKIDLDEDQVRPLNGGDQVKNRTGDRLHVTLELHKTKDAEFGGFKYVVSIAGHSEKPGTSIHENDRQKAKKILRHYLYECLKEMDFA